ncbi:6579_t:CDS:2 [Ambispora gerdemannii]|uniref:6579_t:CDS:1 n=1 Tax=Ambispora gerdemannii TaxID=144530 RepID=A0A9N9BKJ5_9GLOM|nr:6579_t:CDS:2 [Ambispora gerdemannii]
MQTKPNNKEILKQRVKQAKLIYFPNSISFNISEIIGHYGIAVETDTNDIWVIHNTQNGTRIDQNEILDRDLVRESDWYEIPRISTVEDFYLDCGGKKRFGLFGAGYCWNSTERMLKNRFRREDAKKLTKQWTPWKNPAKLLCTVFALWLVIFW